MTAELEYWCGLVDVHSVMSITFVVLGKPWDVDDHKRLMDRVNVRVCGALARALGISNEITHCMTARDLQRAEGGIELFFPTSHSAIDAAQHQPAVAAVTHPIELFRYNPGFRDEAEGNIRQVTAGMGCPRNAVLRLYWLLEDEYRDRVRIVSTVNFPEDDDPIWGSTPGIWNDTGIV